VDAGTVVPEARSRRIAAVEGTYGSAVAASGYYKNGRQG